jgi:hypothetical protein
LGGAHGWRQAFSTGLANIVHFADWIPGTNSIAYSTVEPRAAAPGWQANNDLSRYSISTGEKRKILDASSGGVYGWWGMTFAFSSDGRLAYARPDGIGLVDIDGKYLKPLLNITPLNTHSDWAWLPSIAWGADGKTCITFHMHRRQASSAQEDSPFFDIMPLHLITARPFRSSNRPACLPIHPLRSAIERAGAAVYENFYHWSGRLSRLTSYVTACFQMGMKSLGWIISSPATGKTLPTWRGNENFSFYKHDVSNYIFVPAKWMPSCISHRRPAPTRIAGPDISTCPSRR